MASENIFKDIFLAGVGAMSLTGEKAHEVVNKLIDQGEITVEQGQKISDELVQKATDTANSVHDTALEAYINAMSPDARNSFALKVQDMVASANERQAADAHHEESAS